MNWSDMPTQCECCEDANVAWVSELGVTPSGGQTGAAGELDGRAEGSDASEEAAMVADSNEGGETA